MKRYYENWINPKTNQTEKIEVSEYSYEDFEEGLISGNWCSGKQLYYNSNENKFSYDYLPLEEVEKIRARQIYYYNEKVEYQQNILINNFINRYEQSENKERLYNTEIEKFEKLLFQEKMPLNNWILCSTDFPIKDLRFNSIQIDSIRKIYDKIIVNGQKDYSLTNSPNMRTSIGSGDYWNIQVEAINKFYNWLKKDFAKNYSVDKIQITFWLFLKESGMLRRAYEKGFTINPTHNFELLLETRLLLFNEAKNTLIQEREAYNLLTTEYELNLFYSIWLKNEILVIEQWLSDKYPNGNKKKRQESTSNRIEIIKYQNYVQQEIEKLEKLINKTKEVQVKEKNDLNSENNSGSQLELSKTRKIISEQINSIDNIQGWKYVFRHENDYNNFIDLLTDYFEGKLYALPDKPIMLQNGCKTRLALIFNTIWDEFKEGSINNNDYFNIIRILSPFRNETNIQIYKAVKRA